MRTTIEINDDLYSRIIQRYGKRKISVAINEILFKFFAKNKKDMFGADSWLKDTKFDDLRDENDRNI